MPQLHRGGDQRLSHKSFFVLLSVFLILLVTTSCHSSRNAAMSSLAADANNFYEDDNICLPNYEISDGSIIKVNDSQAIGAHYISETDLGPKSREDCLRLCCRTPACNVAVFEEKGSGSCYMFDCGPPLEFRCKFTSQAYYMVAILRRRDIMQQRQQLILQQQQQHNTFHNTQHEAELSQLRNVETDKGTANANVPSSSMVDATKSKQEEGLALRIGSVVGNGYVNANSNGNSITTTTTAASLMADNNSHRCSPSSQFECKTSHECIGIYNKCDGISQCKDGSDELLCVSDNLLVPKLEPKPKTSMTLPLPLSQSATSGGAQADTIVNTMSKPSQEDFHLSQSSSSSAQLSMGNPIDNRKIFTHKEGGILDDSYGLQQQLHSPYWKSYDYGNVEPPNGYGPPMSLPQLPSAIGISNGGYGGSLNTLSNNYGSAPYQYPGYPQQQQQSQQQLPHGGIPQLPMYGGNNVPLQQQQQYYNNNPNNPLVISSSNVNNNNMMSQNPAYMDSSRFLSRMQSQSGLQQQQQQQMQMQSTAGTTTTVSTTTTLKSMTTGRLPNQQQSGSAITSVASAVPINDAEKLEAQILKRMKSLPFTGETSDVQAVELEAHSAGAGAVFVFIMGVGMSVVMVIIVGCRLRRMGTRRRGKNRLDDGYLVDGMYL